MSGCPISTCGNARACYNGIVPRGFAPAPFNSERPAMQKTSKFLRGMCLGAAVAIGSATLVSTVSAQTSAQKNSAAAEQRKQLQERQLKLKELKDEQKRI